MNKCKEFTRQELYDLVWSTPMVKLAKDFGLSDVGLRKICVKHEIPTPPLGYWAKLNFGKPVVKTALAPASEGISSRVLVSIFSRPERPTEVAEAEISARRIIREPIAVPTEAPQRLHPHAKSFRQALRAAKPDEEEFVRVGQSGVLSATIGRANADRAVLIVEAIFRALEAAGHEIKATESGVSAVINGEAVVLEIGESKNKKEHQPTKGELKAKADWEERRSKWPTLYGSDRRHWRTWDYFPSGRLSISVVDPLRTPYQSDHVIGRWHDRKAKRLEDFLSEIVVAMFAGAALVRCNRVAAEDRRRRREEAHQAYLREQERLRYLAQVDAFIESKANEYARLQKVLSLRGYISKHRTLAPSPEEDAILAAVDDLVGRLEHGLSPEAVRQAIELSD